MFEIIIILALILLNGIFSMSEMALVSSKKYKLESAKKKGVTGSRTALELLDNPTRFFSTVQIGITLIGILLGIYSGDKLTTDVETYLNQFPLLAPYAHNVAVVLILVFITFFSILLGELFPKRLGMSFPEPITLLLAKPMALLSKLTSPFVWLLSTSNDLLLKLFRINQNAESRISEEEIKSIIKESAEGGEIQDIEQDIVERVFELGDRKVSSLMTHRTDVVYFNNDITYDQLFNVVSENKHSAYPVCKNNKLDEIIGIVQLKDLFINRTESEFDITKLVTKPLYLTENNHAYSLLEEFKTKKIHFGVVLDEYGSVLGIVTMDDVVDALVGDTSQTGQDEYQLTKRNDGSWLVDGQYSFMDFAKEFDLHTNHTMQDKYTTVAGFIIYHENAIPEIGDIFIKDGLQYEVLDKDGQRIDKILVSKS